MKATTSGTVDLMAALLASLERAKAARESGGSHATEAAKADVPPATANTAGCDPLG